MSRMNKTNIEWAQNQDGSQGFTLNIKTGCLNHTPEGLCLGGLFPCYAYKLANGRLRKRYLANQLGNAPLKIEYARTIPHYPIEPTKEDYTEYTRRCLTDPFYPRWWPERLKEPCRLGKGQFGMAMIPKGFFLDDMSDWLGSYWPEGWTEDELQMMRDNPQHRIYTLTKQPQNLAKWSPFPDNCWVGVTVCNNTMYGEAYHELACVDAKVKFYSFEPLLSPIGMSSVGLERRVDWLIIGAMTGTKKNLTALSKNPYLGKLTMMLWGKRWTLQPQIEWVEEIVKAADQAGIPVFLKDNLQPLLFNKPEFWDYHHLLFHSPNGKWLRQEMPGLERLRHG